jgi:hypothetical protein
MSPRWLLLGDGRLDPLATPFLDASSAFELTSQNISHDVRVQARGKVSPFDTK